MSGQKSSPTPSTRYGLPLPPEYTDPAGSVYSGGSGRPYLVEGVGEDFWPETYDRTIADRIIEVSDADSFGFTRRLAREEALLVGGSSGMAAFAAVQLAHELSDQGA